MFIWWKLGVIGVVRGLRARTGVAWTACHAWLRHQSPIRHAHEDQEQGGSASSRKQDELDEAPLVLVHRTGHAGARVTRRGVRRLEPYSLARLPASGTEARSETGRRFRDPVARSGDIMPGFVARRDVPISPTRQSTRRTS